MISYTDSEVRTFHPLCEKALTQAIAALARFMKQNIMYIQEVLKWTMLL